MPIEFHGSDVALLLKILDGVKQGHSLEDSEINEIMISQDIDIWLKAYEPWITDVRNVFHEIMKSLHLEETDNLFVNIAEENVVKWGEHINKGFRLALENLPKLKISLDILASFDWVQTEENTLNYLPENTPLDAHIVMTIDGFNGGMVRENYTFLSLLMLEPSSMKPEKFTHEFHHSGFSYWWKQHPLVERYGAEKGTKEDWLLNLFQYLVSEGLANAFCSPSAITVIEGDGERIVSHNKIITSYEDSLDKIFDLVETLLASIHENKLDSIKEQYEALALDMEYGALPKGHFLSGRMVQAMDKSDIIQKGQLIDLVKQPFIFFKLYNQAAEELNLRKISADLLETIDTLLQEMKSS